VGRGASWNWNVRGGVRPRLGPSWRGRVGTGPGRKETGTGQCGRVGRAVEDGLVRLVGRGERGSGWARVRSEQAARFGLGKRRVGHGPLRVGLGCELGFLGCYGFGFEFCFGFSFYFYFYFSFLFLIQTKFEFKY